MKWHRLAAAPLLAGALVVGGIAPASAHCDTLDGPVVSSARIALDTGNPNPVLGWVQKKDEAEILAAFDQARAVRKGGGPARELADTYFFETLVRVHRAGEGAPYTGLKPAGEIEPAVAAADRAIATGELAPLGKLVGGRMEEGLHRHYEAVMAKKPRDPNDVEAARAYSKAYVEFVHYADRLYGAADTLAPQHGH